MTVLIDDYAKDGAQNWSNCYVVFVMNICSPLINQSLSGLKWSKSKIWQKWIIQIGQNLSEWSKFLSGPI